MAKKYLSKITKDGQTVHIKDAEARAAIDNLPADASVQTCEDIIDELV